MLRGKGLRGKFHFTRWGIVVLALVLALGTIGVTYAGMKGPKGPKPPGNDVVMRVDSFTWTVSNDNGGEEIGGIYDPIDPGDNGLDPSAPPPAPGETCDRYDKNVASTTAALRIDPVTGEVDPYNIDVTIDKAYPSYYSTVFFGMTGCEEVPAQIMAIIIDEDFHPNEEDNVADDIAALDVTVGGIEIGQVIDPGVEVVGYLAVHVEQVALQNHTYTIRVTIGVDCAAEKKCGTAYAYGGPPEYTDPSYAHCFDEFGFKNWGWTNGPLQAGEYTFDMYAGAGGCDITGLEPVGTLTIDYDGSTAIVTYTLYNGYTMDETHLYVGNEPLPTKNNGTYTVSPGQYPYTHPLEDATSDTYTISGLSGEIYVVAHAVPCWFE